MRSSSNGILNFLLVTKPMELNYCLAVQQVNEEASEKVLEVEQKYNGVRRPVYVKRNEVIKSIPDFWLTAVRIPAILFSCSLLKNCHTIRVPLFLI